MKKFTESQSQVAEILKKDYRITKDYLRSVHGIRTLPYLSNLKRNKYVSCRNPAKVIRGNPVILLLMPSASKPASTYKTVVQQFTYRALLSVSTIQAKQNKDSQ